MPELRYRDGTRHEPEVSGPGRAKVATGPARTVSPLTELIGERSPVSTTTAPGVQAGPTGPCTMCGLMFPLQRVVGPSGKTIWVPPVHVVPEPVRPPREPVFVREGPAWYEPID